MGADDGGLQYERTELAWRRTALASAALSMGFVRAHFDELDAPAVVAISVAAAVVLATLAVVVRAPDRRDGRVPAVLASLVAAIAVAELVSRWLG